MLAVKSERHPFFSGLSAFSIQGLSTSVKFRKKSLRLRKLINHGIYARAVALNPDGPTSTGQHNVPDTHVGVLSYQQSELIPECPMQG